MKVENNMKLVKLFCVFLMIAAGASAKTNDAVWSEIDDTNLQNRPFERQIVPDEYRTFRLNKKALNKILNQAPLEFTEASQSKEVILTLPMPDGSFERFRIDLSPIVEEGLSNKFPELRQTFRGQGIDDPAATVRFDLLPQGFHAMILSNKITVLIDPYAKGDTENYISYRKNDFHPTGEKFHCDVRDGIFGKYDLSKFVNIPASVINGSQLRTYRIAVASPVEYTTAAGGTVAGALAAQVALMNRVNAPFEREAAIRFVIVANNNLIVFTAEPDGYDGENMAFERNQMITDANIGNGNYDIGHLINIGSNGGFAATPSACDMGGKAHGFSGPGDSTANLTNATLVGHEIGHQFGANHTFNTSASGCNRASNAAYEPGTGVTIMSYAGVCAPQNLANDAYEQFHVKSLEEMIAFKETGGSCGAATANGNTPPTVSIVGGTSYNIPKQTPFILTAAANDANGDAVTYDWQEYDLGAESSAIPNSDADGNARPIFRGYLPQTNGARTFPSLQYILNNANVPPPTYDCGTMPQCLTGEILPAITRTMNFQVLVRDNRANGGGINTATATVNIDGNSGPFNITAPNTAVSVNGGSSQTVTWNVANTIAAPVNTANVRILLSTDGGNTFPNILINTTPNDGSETIFVPNTATTQARIKVESVGNIFFDISDANFTISALAETTATTNGNFSNPGTWDNGVPNATKSGTIAPGVIVNLNGNRDAALLNVNGTLEGTGTLDGNIAVENGGAISPGNSPGIMVLNGNLNMKTGAILTVEVNGTNVGTQYDQLQVNGGVTINGATLGITFGFAPVAGNTFVLIDNDGNDSINGTFQNIPQGFQLPLGGNLVASFSYTGGDGNDFVATIIPVLSANTSISGRVQTADGTGIRGAIVQITDQSGATRSVKTGTFGYYRFDAVVVGETYILTVANKRFTFANQTRIISVTEELTEVNFTAEP